MSVAREDIERATGAADRGGDRRTRRLPLILLLAGSLVGASLLRGVFVDKYGAERAASGAASVGQFNSYTLGLLLGGLRGPLVMTLWSTSETQKSERNLEDINTKIELIGLLQPEFDAVHLFQIWNKAYNLSVQMSNLPSKYATILDALDYADKRREGRANINVEAAVASIYFDKLGGSSEKQYYRQRIRDETRTPTGQTKIVFPEARRNEFVLAALAAGADARRFTLRPESGEPGRLSTRLPDWYADPLLANFKGDDVATTKFAPRDTGRQQAARTSMRSNAESVLDSAGRLLPAFADRSLIAAGVASAEASAADAAPLVLLPATSPATTTAAAPTIAAAAAASLDGLPPAVAADAQWRPDAGELAYLVRFEPYPYGVSPFAFGYNYYKRSVALQESLKQTHAQLSDRVISSRPALSLKGWAEEELELGRLAEMAQFGLKPESEEVSVLPMELPASAIGIDAVPLTPLLDEAIYFYDHVADLADQSVVEFRAHGSRHKDDDMINQLADVAGKGALARADATFLRAITATDDAARRSLAKRAVEEYRRAIELFDRNVLAYYVPDDVIAATFPTGYGKVDVINSFLRPAAFPSELVMPTMERAVRTMMSAPEPPGTEVGEYQTYVARAQARLSRLGPLVN